MQVNRPEYQLLAMSTHKIRCILRLQTDAEVHKAKAADLCSVCTLNIVWAIIEILIELVFSCEIDQRNIQPTMI